MKRFNITFAITGGVTIEAETEAEAKEKFNKYKEHELYEHANPSEITEIFEEEDD